MTIRFYAHRGASQYAPENTLLALCLAKELGAQWAEFDVQVSIDNMAFVFHDEDLKRVGRQLSQGKWVCLQQDHTPYQMTFAKIQQYNIGEWFQEEHPLEAEKLNVPLSDITTPSLQKWLNVSKGLGLALNLELKIPELLYLPEHTATLISYRERLINSVKHELNTAQWPIDQMILSSFDSECLNLALAHMPQYSRAALFAHNWPNLAEFENLTQKQQCVALNLDIATFLNIAPAPEVLEKIQNQPLPINIYTVNTHEELEALKQRANELQILLAGVFVNDLKIGS